MDSFNEKSQFTSGSMVAFITWQQCAMHNKYICDGIHTFKKSSVNSPHDYSPESMLHSPSDEHQYIWWSEESSSTEFAMYPCRPNKNSKMHNSGHHSDLSPTPRLKQNYLRSTQMQMKNLLKQIHAHQNNVTHANGFATSKHPPNWNELNTCLWDKEKSVHDLNLFDQHKAPGVLTKRGEMHKAVQIKYFSCKLPCSLSSKEHLQTEYFMLVVFRSKILKQP